MKRLPRFARPLEQIDYDLLAQVYREAHWRWRETGIPNAERLRANAEYLLSSINKSNCQCAGTGGMFIRRNGESLMLELDPKLEALYATAIAQKV